MNLPRLSLLLVLALTPCTLTTAADPAWWAARGVTTAAAPSNKSPATIGQAKWIAFQALAELQDKLSGPDFLALKASVEAVMPLATPQTPAAAEKLRGVLRVGQLKAIAQPFYDRLRLIDSDWLNRQMTDAGTRIPTAGSNPVVFHPYPWTTVTTAANHAPASLGQLKAVFALSFQDWSATNSDFDQDGLTDNWESLYFSNFSTIGSVDSDGDGYTNAEESAMASNPVVAEKDTNLNGLPDAWEAANIGKFSVFPPLLSVTRPRGKTLSAPVILRNDTATAVDYSVYRWGGSGPAYTYKIVTYAAGPMAWNDISVTGTLLADVSASDDSSQLVDFSGFNFGFYGVNYSQVHVGSNGILTFGNGNSSGVTASIPGTSAPAAMIAPFWADLRPLSSGGIYFKNYGSCLVFQYNEIRRRRQSGSNTFQVTLYANGSIHFFYKSMDDDPLLSVVGIQDMDRIQGFEVPIIEKTFFTNGELQISPRSESRNLSLPPLLSIPARTTVTIPGTLSSLTLPAGIYQSNSAFIPKDQRIPPRVNVSKVTVVDPPATVAISQPATGTSIAAGNINLEAVANDADGIAVVKFYDGNILLGEDRTVPYSYVVGISTAGPHTFSAMAIDTFGSRYSSTPVSVTILSDSDGDGMPDNWEAQHGFDPTVNDSHEDADRDGFTNLEEYIAGTNPRIANGIVDSDNDGMPDLWEARYNLRLYWDDSRFNPDGDFLTNGSPFTNLMEFRADSDPQRTDTDSDGMPDGWEVSYSLKPRQNDANLDPDADSYSNLEEFQNGTNPRIFNPPLDLDNDGMSDSWEVRNGLNPTLNDSALDPDADGLTNLQEFQFRTNPTNPDTDGDSLPDGWEIRNQLDPNNSTGKNGKDGDPDQDGVSNFLEWQHGCDPNKADTDSDGTADGPEINQGSDPNNGTDGGLPPPPETMIEVPFRVGDPSDSHSETWCLKIIPKGPEDLRQPIKVASKNYGEMAEQTIKLRKNNKYEIVLEHLRTNPEYLESNNGDSDYDWEAQIDSKPTIQVLDDLGINTGDNRYFIVKDHWIIDNKDGLLGTVDQDFDASNYTTGKKATLLPIEIQEVRFAGSNYHQLKSDNGNTIYSAPHWVDLDRDGKASTNTSSGEKNYPVSFTRNTKPEVGVKFKVAGLEGGQSLKIKADSSQGLQIPETTVSSAADGTITLPLTPASNNLANSIDFFSSGDSTAFKIDWKMSIGSSEWGEVASTKHTVYIMMANPLSTANALRRESLFSIGCRNAKGEGSSAQGVVDAIYNEFKDRVVHRSKPSSGDQDNVTLTYWAGGQGLFTTEALLEQSNCKCGGWAKFFIDVLRAQGIDSQLISVLPPQPSAADLQAHANLHLPAGTTIQYEASQMARLFVKTYNIAGNPFNPQNLNGVAAQGNGDPHSRFTDHALVEYGGKLYDPSYGTGPFNNLTAWEDLSMEAFGGRIPFSNSQGQGELDWIWKADPKGSAESRPNPSTY